MTHNTHYAIFLHEPALVYGATLFGLLAVVLAALLTLFSLSHQEGSDA